MRYNLEAGMTQSIEIWTHAYSSIYRHSGTVDLLLTGIMAR